MVAAGCNRGRGRDATYGIMYGMLKTTIYLPEELKRQVEIAAKLDGRSEAEIMREAVAEAMRKRVRPKPRIPLFEAGTLPSDLAERVDDYLEGFGE